MALAKKGVCKSISKTVTAAAARGDSLESITNPARTTPAIETATNGEQ
jgi:hypothetical protein